MIVPKLLLVVSSFRFVYAPLNVCAFASEYDSLPS